MKFIADRFKMNQLYTIQTIGFSLNISNSYDLKFTISIYEFIR